jgi:hypothetical protein
MAVAAWDKNVGREEDVNFAKRPITDFEIVRMFSLV